MMPEKLYYERVKELREKGVVLERDFGDQVSVVLYAKHDLRIDNVETVFLRVDLAHQCDDWTVGKADEARTLAYCLDEAALFMDSIHLDQYFPELFDNKTTKA